VKHKINNLPLYGIKEKIGATFFYSKKGLKKKKEK